MTKAWLNKKIQNHKQGMMQERKYDMIMIFISSVWCEPLYVKYIYLYVFLLPKYSILKCPELKAIIL